jgi:hypothetical protein
MIRKFEYEFRVQEKVRLRKVIRIITIPLSHWVSTWCLGLMKFVTYLRRCPFHSLAGACNELSAHWVKPLLASKAYVIGAVQSLWFKVKRLGFRVYGLGFMV